VFARQAGRTAGSGQQRGRRVYAAGGTSGGRRLDSRFRATGDALGADLSACAGELGMFPGGKADPGGSQQVQPIGKQINLHGGINLTRSPDTRRASTMWPPAVYDQCGVNTMIQRVRTDAPTTATCTMRSRTRGGSGKSGKTRPERWRAESHGDDDVCASMLDCGDRTGSTTRSSNTGWGPGAEAGGRRY